MSCGALQPPADDLVVPLGQVAAARFPDPDDRQPPSRLFALALTFSLGLRGGGELRVGGDKDAQPLRLARCLTRLRAGDPGRVRRLAEIPRPGALPAAA